MQEVNGIYGANVPRWSDHHWDLIDIGKFKWVIVRSDCSVEVARMLKERGIEVIVQMPDAFNKNAWLSPASWIHNCIAAASHFRHYSNMIVLDNEPNLHKARADTWHAEQYCRWYRALLALFRFYNHASHWTILFPAMSPRPELNPLKWLLINEENIRESPAIASHIYWSLPDDWLSSDWGAFYRNIHVLYPNKDQYVIEYGCANHGLDPQRLGLHYRDWLDYLPTYVKCGCLFILGGTPEWKQWHLQEATARELGR